MNQEDVLHMIDTITHPVNMGSGEAIEFLDALGTAIHERELRLMHERDKKEAPPRRCAHD
jgi:hypothetical protein